MLENLGVAPVPSDDPIPHTRYGGVVHLGRQRFPFGGTDTLSMSIQPLVTTWLLTETRNLIVVGEGDRLTNAKFFDALRAARIPMHIALLDLIPSEARARSLARAAEHGVREQALSWFQGRVTKVDNIAGRYRCTIIDARQPPEAIAKELWAAAALPEGPVSARVGPVGRPPAT
jgi:hypothetical protein